MDNNTHNNNDIALQVQRYHLGLMTPDEAVAFERAAAASPEIAEELRQAGDGLTSLYENLAKDLPSPRKALKNKILAEIGADLSPMEADTDSFILRAADAKWVSTNIPGIEFKILYKDEADRTMLIARFAPGASLPSHRRLGTEECYVLSGDFWADGQKLGAGDFIAGLAGNEPDPVYSEGGCELLLKLPIPHELFPN
ncbi:MAG: cupin domain-containing protein [Ignavibacteriota bacterium]